MSKEGHLPHPVIKGFVFWILTVCLAVATASRILLEWGAIGEVVASRCLVTALLLGLGSVAFLILNFFFGDLGHLLVGSSDPTPPLDSAFSERLRNAKIGNPSGERLSRAGEESTTSDAPK